MEDGDEVPPEVGVVEAAVEVAAGAQDHLDHRHHHQAQVTILQIIKSNFVYIFLIIRWSKWKLGFKILIIKL